MTRDLQLRSLLSRWLLPPFAPFALQPIAKVRDKGGFQGAMATGAVIDVRKNPVEAIPEVMQCNPHAVRRSPFHGEPGADRAVGLIRMGVNSSN